MVESLAEFPAALPRLLVGVWCPRAVENAFPVDRTEVGERVAQGPTFLKSCFERFDLAVLAECWFCELVGIIVVVVVSIHFMALWYHCKTFVRREDFRISDTV